MKHPDKILRLDILRYRRAGMPKHLIARMLAMKMETLEQYYSRELETGHPEMIAELASCAYERALAGNDKLTMFLLKTQGSKFGFNEKQIIETVNRDETVDELKEKIKELEDEHDKEF